MTLSVAANKIFHRFNCGVAIFGLDKKPEDSYNLLQKNIVGGPSFVGEDENSFVKSIVGYDDNALYLSAVGGNILT